MLFPAVLPHPINNVGGWGISYFNARGIWTDIGFVKTKFVLDEDEAKKRASLIYRRIQAKARKRKILARENIYDIVFLVHPYGDNSNLWAISHYDGGTGIYRGTEKITHPSSDTAYQHVKVCRRKFSKKV